MFLDFFFKLKDARIPVSLNEFFTFLQSIKLDFIEYDINKFYYLARTSLIKDERLIDRFDVIFGQYFKGIESIKLDDILDHLNVPKETKFDGISEKIVSKNSKGETVIYEIKIILELEVYNDKIKHNKKFSSKLNYNNNDNKFELNQYEIEIEKQIMNDLIEEIILFLSTL